MGMFFLFTGSERVLGVGGGQIWLMFFFLVFKFKYVVYSQMIIHTEYSLYIDRVRLNTSHKTLKVATFTF